MVESDEEEVEEDALQLEFEEPARTLCPPATRASDVSRAPSDGAHSAQVAERPSVRNHRRLSLVSQGKLVTQAPVVDSVGMTIHDCFGWSHITFDSLSIQEYFSIGSHCQAS